MSQAHILNLTPDISITRSDMTKLLLASIALREIGIAQIINTEAKMVQLYPGKIRIKNTLNRRRNSKSC